MLQHYKCYVDMLQGGRPRLKIQYGSTSLVLKLLGKLWLGATTVLINKVSRPAGCGPIITTVQHLQLR